MQVGFSNSLVYSSGILRDRKGLGPLLILIIGGPMALLSSMILLIIRAFRIFKIGINR